MIWGCEEFKVLQDSTHLSIQLIFIDQSFHSARRKISAWQVTLNINTSEAKKQMSFNI